MSQAGGVFSARDARAIARRAAVALTLQALLLGVLHAFLPAHGPDLVVAGHETQAVGHHATTAGTGTGHGTDQHHESVGQQSAAPHADHDGPVCHQDGIQDESALAARADRLVTPDLVCGLPVAVVVATPHMSPDGPRAVETAPARTEGGRHHLALAQISRT